MLPPSLLRGPCNTGTNTHTHSRHVRRGGGVHMHLPTWEKNSSQKCPKEKMKFRPDIYVSKKRMCTLRYDKIKRKKVGKKEEKSERKG